MTDIPADVMRLAEEALDNLLCNCTDSCGGYDGLRAASILDIARYDDARDALIERLERTAREISGMADSAYCASLNKFSSAPCLGWEAKVASGEFGEDEMDTHAEANRLMGKHQGLAEALKLIRCDKTTAEANNPDLEAALDAFWNVAYQQGHEQRGHDDEEGTAQKAEDALRRAIAAISGSRCLIDKPEAGEAEPVAWLRHGEEVPVQNVPFGAMWISDKDDPRAFPVYATRPASTVAVPEGWGGRAMSMFPKIEGIYALLDGCPTRCAVHEFRENLFVATGAFFSLLTALDDGSFSDGDGRKWTIVGTLQSRGTQREGTDMTDIVVTDEMVAAYRSARAKADEWCGRYNKFCKKHYITDGVREIWSLVTEDYETGHAAMMAELQKLRDAAALSAAICLIDKPEAGEEPTPWMIEAAWQAYQNFPIDLCGDHDEEQKKSVVAALRAALSAALDKPEAGEAGETVPVSGITLRTINHRDYGQDIAVYAVGADGREVEVIREFGAFPDISIDHHVTNHGLSALLPPASPLSAGKPEAGEAEPVANAMSFFSENVDRWGAAEWFDRLAKAIREQDKAVVAKNDIAFETYRNIAASSARRLVRDYEYQVRAALSSSPLSAGDAGEVERLPYELRLKIGKALDRLVCDESTPEQVDQFIKTFADFGLTIAPADKATVREEPVVWMHKDHVRHYREKTADGIFWAHHSQTEFYTVPLYAAPVAGRPDVTDEPATNHCRLADGAEVERLVKAATDFSMLFVSDTDPTCLHAEVDDAELTHAYVELSDAIAALTQETTNE